MIHETINIIISASIWTRLGAKASAGCSAIVQPQRRFAAHQQTKIMNIGSEVVSLAQLSHGQCAQVLGFDGGRSMTQRMVMLGLRRGVALCVVHGPGARGTVVQVGGARIALGRGVTDKIRVMPVNARMPQGLAA
jgi:ferrous iron transport protein A